MERLLTPPSYSWEAQTYDFSCWAACISSVEKFLGIVTDSQERNILNQYYSSLGRTSPFNLLRRNSQSLAIDKLANFEIYLTQNLLFSYSELNNCTFDSLKLSIDGNFPIIYIFVGGRNVGVCPNWSHFVRIIGYDNEKKLLFIQDPKPNGKGSLYIKNFYNLQSNCCSNALQGVYHSLKKKATTSIRGVSPISASIQISQILDSVNVNSIERFNFRLIETDLTYKNRLDLIKSLLPNDTTTPRRFEVINLKQTEFDPVDFYGGITIGYFRVEFDSSNDIKIIESNSDASMIIAIKGDKFLSGFTFAITNIKNGKGDYVLDRIDNLSIFNNISTSTRNRIINQLKRQRQGENQATIELLSINDNHRILKLDDDSYISLDITLKNEENPGNEIFTQRSFYNSYLKFLFQTINKVDFNNNFKITKFDTLIVSF